MDKDEVDVQIIESKHSSFATWIHISALIGGVLSFLVPFFWPIIFPLVMWLMKKKESSFIDFHGREAVRFQFFMTLYGFLLIFMPIVFIFGTAALGASSDPFIVGDILLASGGIMILVFLAAIALMIIDIVFPIIAAIRASDGKSYCYPLTFSPRKRSASQVA